jgi:hypothetical protein
LLAAVEFSLRLLDPRQRRAQGADFVVEQFCDEQRQALDVTLRALPTDDGRTRPSALFHHHQLRGGSCAEHKEVHDITHWSLRRCVD